MAACPVCGKSRKVQGGQETCMNESCPEYLVGKKTTSKVAPVAAAIEKQK